MEILFYRKRPNSLTTKLIYSDLVYIPDLNLILSKTHLEEYSGPLRIEYSISKKAEDLEQAQAILENRTYSTRSKISKVMSYNCDFLQISDLMSKFKNLEKAQRDLESEFEELLNSC